jgi:hypothetical protein
LYRYDFVDKRSGLFWRSTFGEREFADLQGQDMTKPIVLEFVGGSWDGNTLRSDSSDQEEQFLAAGCYEMSHHGAIGEECVGLSDDAVTFARRHGWKAAEEAPLCGDHRYLVVERRETETEIIVTFLHELLRNM